jgi:cellulose synthase (UDP-forming)
LSKIGFAILWAVATAAVIFLLTLPISLQAQLIAGSMVVATMMVLKLVRPEGTWRLISLALGTAIVLRYVYWRTTSTQPPFNQPENFVPGFLLYLAEIYNCFMLGLSLFVVARPLPSRAAPPSQPPEALPTVDVFVPSYNEDARLLATTLARPRAWTIRQTSSPSGCSMTAAPTRSAIPTTSKPRSPPRNAAPRCRSFAPTWASDI